MLNALAKLWKLIVKALTLATNKGEKYVDSLSSPIDELNAKIEKINSNRRNIIHAYYELVRQCNTNGDRVTEYTEECTKIEQRIQTLIKSGDEKRAKNEARLLLQKEKTLKRTIERKKQLDDRCTEMAYRIETMKTDVTLLEDKVVDLKAVLAMRDDSKLTAGGVSGDFDASIKEILNDADRQIQDVENQDKSWKVVNDTVNSNDDTDSNDDSNDVKSVLNRFR